ADDEAPIADIIADPVEEVGRLPSVRHPRIPLPRDLFLPRRNSAGYPLWDDGTRARFLSQMAEALRIRTRASAIVAGSEIHDGKALAITAPHDRRVIVGEVSEASDRAAAEAMAIASHAQDEWDRRGGAERARILEGASDLYEENTAKLMALLVREAGKTLENALSDLREAVDFLRYYAELARRQFVEPRLLPGPTGERNELTLQGRGVFACISPWNFPLAIFTGQVAAALAAGNAVIAKPAEQTPLVAFEAVKLLHSA